MSSARSAFCSTARMRPSTTSTPFTAFLAASCASVHRSSILSAVTSSMSCSALTTFFPGPSPLSFPLRPLLTSLLPSPSSSTSANSRSPSTFSLSSFSMYLAVLLECSWAAKHSSPTSSLALKMVWNSLMESEVTFSPAFLPACLQTISTMCFTSSFCSSLSPNCRAKQSLRWSAKCPTGMSGRVSALSSKLPPTRPRNAITGRRDLRMATLSCWLTSKCVHFACLYIVEVAPKACSMNSWIKSRGMVMMTSTFTMPVMRAPMLKYLTSPSTLTCTETPKLWRVRVLSLAPKGTLKERWWS
mmetsp:Transcript_96032/g.215096  ORF Transcript_96032/g.215096 Transcript_96032/m.215096 type:complete len:301 (-) Transcript_96032:681-1583(-)